MQEKFTHDFPVLMERRLKLRPALGEPHSDLVIQVGYPVWIQQDFEASCSVAIRGIAGPILNIGGVDPIDAMKNVMIFIENYLDNPKGGAKFLWPNGEEY